MATPVDNAELLLNYWATAITNRDKSFERSTFGPEQLYRAAMAMKELMQQAAENTYTRQAVFAAKSIFSTALLKEPIGFTDWLIANRENLGGYGQPAVVWIALFKDFNNDPPRLIMLDGIHKAATGGLFSPQDPSGLTSWIGNVDGAGAAISSTISEDPNPYVRASALRILRDLALPVTWPQLILGKRALDVLDEQLARSPWDMAVRIALQGLSQAVRGRLLQLQATAATADLPTFPTGDGQEVPTFPPKPKPWYKRGDILGTAAAGLVVGAAYYSTSKPRSAS